MEVLASVGNADSNESAARRSIRRARQRGKHAFTIYLINTSYYTSPSLALPTLHAYPVLCHHYPSNMSSSVESDAQESGVFSADSGIAPIESLQVNHGASTSAQADETEPLLPTTKNVRKHWYRARPLW